MKLKTTETKIVETETDIDLPIYFYFQGELMEEEYMKYDGTHVTKIVFDYFGYTLSRYKQNPQIPEHHLKNLTTEEEFNYVLDRAIKKLS